MLDTQAGSFGLIDVTVDTTSIDMGHDKINDHVKSDAAMLDRAGSDIRPRAIRASSRSSSTASRPKVDGTLTLHGVTKPLTLKIDQFGCRHPMQKGKEVCGANATGTLDRGTFGVDWGKNYGFKMDTKLTIQVEAHFEGGSDEVE